MLSIGIACTEEILVLLFCWWSIQALLRRWNTELVYSYLRRHLPVHWLDLPCECRRRRSSLSRPRGRSAITCREIFPMQRFVAELRFDSSTLFPHLDHLLSPQPLPASVKRRRAQPFVLSMQHVPTQKYCCLHVLVVRRGKFKFLYQERYTA